MPLINKANVVSQLQTTLSGATVATEDTTRLLALLKTAKNAGLYSANVETELLTRIGLVSTSNTVTEIALRAKAADLVHFDRQLSTANLTTLNAFSANVGTIVYVDSEGVPYIRKNNNTWSFVDAIISTQLKNAWGWGTNSSGPIGDNTTTTRLSPVSVVGGFTDWIELSAGTQHSLGIRANGTLWGWGRNVTGNVGDGTTSNRSSPVSVIGGFTDWISVSAGRGQGTSSHSLGLRANGTLWGWGSNGLGRIGDGTTSNRSSPVSVIGGFTDWKSMSAGNNHSLAIRGNGILYAWGGNTYGQLGDGTTSNRSSPVSVVGGFTDWTFISAGSNISIFNQSASAGIRSNGTLWAWGYNQVYGALGDGTLTDRSSPVSVVGGFADWVTVSMGSYHCTAVRANGTAWCWGYGGSGQLGNNGITNTSSPVSVVGGFTDWVFTSAGKDTSVGLRANGTLWGWGINNFGQIGDNTAAISRRSPVSVVGGFTDWISVSTTELFTLGLRGG